MEREYTEPQIEVIEGKLQSMICISLEANLEKNTSTMDSLDDIEFEEE